MHFSPRTRPARLVLLLFLAASLAATGCGKPKCTVSGKVLFRSAPLKGGTVTFINDDGSTQPSAIAEDGSYTIRGIHPGEVKILVETKSLKPSSQTTGHRYERPKPPEGQEAGPYSGPNEPGDKAKRYIEIPDKYSEPGTTTLKYTVQRGEQTYDIEVPEG